LLGGALEPLGELPQPIKPAVTATPSAISNMLLRQRRLGRSPKHNRAASETPAPLKISSFTAEAVAAVVETVSVLETGVVPLIWAWAGLSAQVGGSLAVPWP
jgi:hypothetical protein